MPQITTGWTYNSIIQTQPVTVFPAGTATGGGVIYSSIATWGANKNNFSAAIIPTGTFTGGVTASLLLSHDGLNFWVAATSSALVGGTTINLSVAGQVADYAAVSVSGAWTGGGTLTATVAAAL